MEPRIHPTDPSRYEVLPTPDAEVSLWPGDEIWMQYDLIDAGDWFVGYQVGKIEKRIEDDGRFRLDSYNYDAENNRITFKCTVRDEPAIQMQYAGAFGWGVLAGVIVAATWAFVYKGTEVVTIWRVRQAVKDVMDDPDFPQHLKDDLQRQLDSLDETSIGWDFGGGLGLLAAVVVLYLVWGRK